MDQSLTPATVQAPAPVLSIEDLRRRQNFPLAAMAGLAAAVAGAVLWAVITVASHMQLGIVSVGIGLLIGKTIRKTGQGIDTKFRYLGVACAVIGCLLGAVLVDIALYAEARDLSLADVVQTLNPQAIPALLQATFQPLDLIFYAIAIYQAYKMSCRWQVKKK